MSDTPRTDRMVASWPLESFGEMTGLARQLERENADALEENARLSAAVAERDGHIRQMVEKAAANSLDGYRELGARCAAAELRAERAEAELARMTEMAGANHATWKRSEAELAAERERADRNQAMIDRLMLEYCPDEMTKEQLDNWCRHQQAAPDVALGE